MMVGRCTSSRHWVLAIAFTWTLSAHAPLGAAAAGSSSTNAADVQATEAGSSSGQSGGAVDTGFYSKDAGMEFFAFTDHGGSSPKVVAALPAPPPLDPEAGVPPFQPMLQRPSANASLGLPFLFVHLPKNAGTTVRAALLSTLRQKNGARYPKEHLCVPNKVLCKRGATPLAVVAGHMQYRLSTQALKTRNALPDNTTIPCLTYLRDPAKRLVSYYYWFHQGTKHPRMRALVLQAVQPSVAVNEITGLDRVHRHFFQAPLLALFGSLQPQDYVRRNLEAIGAAKERAMHNLQRCVVANTDDMRASAEMVSYYLPWLAKVLDADAVNKKNSRENASHPRVLHEGAPATPEMIAAPLPDATRQELLKSQWYQEELEVYEFAMKLHQRQLAYAREHATVQPEGPSEVLL